MPKEYRFSFRRTHEDLITAYEAERRIAGESTHWSRVAVILIGAIWRFAAGRHLERKWIEKTGQQEQQIDLSFNDDGMFGVSADGERYQRTWDEFVGVHAVNGGVLIAFSDGLQNWLPKRVFQTSAYRNSFVTFLRTRLRSPQPCTSANEPAGATAAQGETALTDMKRSS